MGYFFAGIVAGGLACAGVFWFVIRSLNLKHEEISSRLNEQADSLRFSLDDEKGKRIQLETELKMERSAAATRDEFLRNAEGILKDSFKSLSGDVLKESNTEFLKLAKMAFDSVRNESKTDLEQRKTAIENLVRPLAESLNKYEKQVSEIEAKRMEAYGALTQQVKTMQVSQEKLEEETGRLVDALSKPQVRGYWGEIQLRRIVEAAGMLEYCDFESQVSVKTEDRLLRPDMIINLPGSMQIIVDAKTPLSDYQKAMSADNDDDKRMHLQAHARAVRSHIKQLSDKQYWNQFKKSPDFVVMFIPGETFYVAALQEDPELINAGFDKKVILASPTTLIALLRVAALGWREEQLAENALKIRDLGKEMYERIVKMTEHLSRLGSHLKNSVSSYNDLVGSVESRVLVSARRFGELGVETHKELPEPPQVELETRKPQASEIENGKDD